MQTFIILWLGQLVSSIGSSMTYFALTLWVWQQTESATAIALILVFYQVPQIVITLFSGILVDRFSRKQLLIFSDIASAGCTISVGILAAFQMLHDRSPHFNLVASDRTQFCRGDRSPPIFNCIGQSIMGFQAFTR